jgi:hypothetical protein
MTEGRAPSDPARSAAPARTFRRSAGTRLIGAACVLLFGGGALSCLLASGATAAFLVLTGLALLSVANLIGACADRFTLDDAGIEYRNAVLSRLGLRPRRVAWEEVERVREHRRPGAGRVEGRPSALFLTLRSGRRMVLDALEDYDEVVREVYRHWDRARPRDDR